MTEYTPQSTYKVPFILPAGTIAVICKIENMHQNGNAKETNVGAP